MAPFLLFCGHYEPLHVGLAPHHSVENVLATLINAPQVVRASGKPSGLFLPDWLYGISIVHHSLLQLPFLHDFFSVSLAASPCSLWLFLLCPQLKHWGSPELHSQPSFLVAPQGWFHLSCIFICTQLLMSFKFVSSARSLTWAPKKNISVST